MQIHTHTHSLSLSPASGDTYRRRIHIAATPSRPSPNTPPTTSPVIFKASLPDMAAAAVAVAVMVAVVVSVMVVMRVMVGVGVRVASIVMISAGRTWFEMVDGRMFLKLSYGQQSNKWSLVLAATTSAED